MARRLIRSPGGRRTSPSLSAGDGPGELVAEVQTVALHDTIAERAQVYQATKPSAIGEKPLTGRGKPTSEKAAPLQPPEKG